MDNFRWCKFLFELLNQLQLRSILNIRTAQDSYVESIAVE